MVKKDTEILGPAPCLSPAFYLPEEYFEYFAPDFTLHPDVSTRIENQNSRQVSSSSSMEKLGTCLGEPRRDLGCGGEMEKPGERRKFLATTLSFISWEAA